LHSETAELAPEEERATPERVRAIRLELVDETSKWGSVAQAKPVDVETQRQRAEPRLAAVAGDPLLDAVERRKSAAHAFDLPPAVQPAHRRLASRRGGTQTPAGRTRPF
jgi:hypothetical protein